MEDDVRFRKDGSIGSHSLYLTWMQTIGMEFLESDVLDFTVYFGCQYCQHFSIFKLRGLLTDQLQLKIIKPALLPSFLRNAYLSWPAQRVKLYATAKATITPTPHCHSQSNLGFRRIT